MKDDFVAGHEDRSLVLDEYALSAQRLTSSACHRRRRFDVAPPNPRRVALDQVRASAGHRGPEPGSAPRVTARRTNRLMAPLPRDSEGKGTAAGVRLHRVFPYFCSNL